jgi:cobalt-precorrin-7 (C5)-methyltransferase
MIICIGAGPGDVGYLTQRGAELIRDADVVAGFNAVVNVIESLIPPTAEVVLMGYRDQVAQLDLVAAAHHAGKKCVVVFMGDIHFSGFQYLERVERACGHPVETLPGISSAQILASRAKVCFDETTFITFHRRGDLTPFKKHLVHVLNDARNAIVIPCPWDAARSFMPPHIATYLLENGVSPDHPTEVWENLTRAEAEWHGTLAECAHKEFSDMSIMLIRTLAPMDSQIEPPPALAEAAK